MLPGKTAIDLVVAWRRHALPGNRTAIKLFGSLRALRHFELEQRLPVCHTFWAASARCDAAAIAAPAKQQFRLYKLASADAEGDGDSCLWRRHLLHVLISVFSGG